MNTPSKFVPRFVARMEYLMIVVLYLSCLHVIQTTARTHCPDSAFRNISLPRQVRVDDLIGQLDEEELVNQLLKGGAGTTHGPAPPIPRLCIRPYQWRSECLHGYAEDGNATSFPQAISLSASFDRRLIYSISRATAFEARAKYNQYVKTDQYEDHKGIHCFSPVVNIMRHPLWGRTQETLGEDPFLTGALSNAFVRGLSGFPLIGRIPHDDKHLYLAAASCKHFAVHDGPENIPVSRLSFEANVSVADMWLTYFPAFKECLEGGAQSVMCSYNGINGVPACANKWLLTSVLRKAWKFPGFVISDEGALQFMVSHHKAFDNFFEAALASVRAGVNIENSVPEMRGVYSDLPLLVKMGVIKRSQLEALARPLFLTRLRQGEFDPPESNPYAKLTPDEFVQSERHRRLSLIAGCKSTVLLKNLHHFLPLASLKPHTGNRVLRKLGLAGPFAKRIDELLGSYAPTRMPHFEVNLERGLLEVADSLQVAEFCTDGAACTSVNESDYLDVLKDKTLQLLVLTVGTGCSLQRESRDRGSMDLPGQQARLLELANTHAPNLPVVLLVFSASPVHITWAVNSSQVHSILWLGFPGQQAGSVVARILLGSPDASVSAIDVQGKVDDFGPHKAHQRQKDGYWWIPAGRLPFTWYRSLDGLADITEYKMTNQTYRFNVLSVCKNLSYITEPCIQVEFPFGYGLSFNKQPIGVHSFNYRNMDVPALAVASTVGFTFTVEVVNQGILACDEVVQVYMDWLTLFNTSASSYFDGKYAAAYRQLVGFRRVSLFPGMATRLRFVVPPERMSVWSFGAADDPLLCPDSRAPGACGAPVPAQGKIQLSVSGQQPYQQSATDSNVVTAFLTVVAQ
uniref:Beta-D-xylosidase 1 n=1 Tax=Schistocephalus solidus TaxID=70667 RepID=A0A0X3NYT8_SCHSO